MTQYEHPQNANGSVIDVDSVAPSARHANLAHDARGAKPRLGGTNSTLVRQLRQNRFGWGALVSSVRQICRRVLDLSLHKRGSVRICRVLMCFSALDGVWYCAFFDIRAIHKRLPRRLKFRNSAKVYETALRGGADLHDANLRAEFEHAIESGRGRVWLQLTPDQRLSLGVAAES